MDETFPGSFDELNHLGTEFISSGEQLDMGGAPGRAVVVIISASDELERSLIVEWIAPAELS